MDYFNSMVTRESSVEATINTKAIDSRRRLLGLAQGVLLLGIALVTFRLNVVCCDAGGERRDLERQERSFTTPAYQQAAFQLLLEDVNRAAQQLGLPERLPIERSDIVEARIDTPFGQTMARCLAQSAPPITTTTRLMRTS